MFYENEVSIFWKKIYKWVVFLKGQSDLFAINDFI